MADITLYTDGTEAATEQELQDALSTKRKQTVIDWIDANCPNLAALKDAPATAGKFEILAADTTGIQVVVHFLISDCTGDAYHTGTLKLLAGLLEYFGGKPVEGETDQLVVNFDAGRSWAKQVEAILEKYN